jgi:hypothetical protein
MHALAKHRLRRREGRVAEVAERVDYSSQSTFSVAFTRYIGLSPTRYAREETESRRPYAYTNDIVARRVDWLGSTTGPPFCCSFDLNFATESRVRSPSSPLKKIGPADSMFSIAVPKLVGFLHHQARLGVTDRENMLLIILMSLEFEDGPVAKKVGSLYQKLYDGLNYDGLNNIIREGQKNSEFRNDVPSREIVSIIVANHDGTFLEWYRPSDELSGPKLVRAMRGIIISGLTG